MPPKVEKRLQELEKQLKNLNLTLKKGKGKGKKGGGPPKPGPSNAPNFSAGSISVFRTEMIKSVKAGDQGDINFTFKIEPDQFPFLAGLGKCFEKVRWQKIHVWWKPAASYQNSGMLAIGMDWDAADGMSPPPRVSVLQYTPCISCHIRDDCQKSPLVIPPARLRTIGWLAPEGGGNPITRRPGTLCISVDSNMKKDELIGEVYIQYRVQMSGTRVSA